MSEIKPGDFVKINGQDTAVEVLSVKGNDLEVAMGIMKMTVKKNKVTFSQPPAEATKSASFDSGNITIDTKEKLLHFQFELDVRGKAKEDVINLLTNWVDDALLLGLPEARIVHGRGSGVLKDTVRSFLRKYKEVESVADEVREKGGDHVTLVKFKA
ncbi:mismatch repair ATPase [Sporocytophaga myxococcoides]|uniref:Mismatch repair ATPase n=1 Tax=Sporocytophaga myxococcoides TaxID=153721 RepID=A0A098LI37_9BACT|nr:Smr/MutS family protein [Sporocytophaga myxococcoides]GAL86661.1 mismatch repair ATPase [Sporocytophaga myxococcoides]